jgi:hypothetical protein
MEKVTLRFISLFFCILVLTSTVSAQNNKSKSNFGKISCPEKRWVIFHPFIAKKTYNLTRYTQSVADSIKNTNILDGDINGGQVDAFKHAYWMATLSQNIKWKKALKLGKAHEKGNYKSHKKGARKGLKETHDKISSDMDMWNNHRGIEIGRALKESDRIIIQQMVIDSIHAGKMKIIKKNSSGHYLDCSGNLIPADSLSGKWENVKCLVPSNSLPDNK